MSLREFFEAKTIANLAKVVISSTQSIQKMALRAPFPRWGMPPEGVAGLALAPILALVHLKLNKKKIFRYHLHYKDFGLCSQKRSWRFCS